MLTAFNDYFGVQINIVVERAKFNKQVQNAEEMDIFTNRLYQQAKCCDYGAWRDILIRDRIVIEVNGE